MIQSTNTRFVLRCGLAACIWLALVGTAAAQVLSLSSLEGYETGQEGTLRIQWGGMSTASGLQVRLPAGWQVLGADVYSPSRGLEEATVRKRGASHHVFVMSPRLTSRSTLLVRFVAGRTVGRSVARVAPLALVDGAAVVDERDAVDQPASTIRAADVGLSRNRVGDFSGTAYVELPRTHAQETPASSYTIALWLRTTRSDQVVLSDWTGDERDDYTGELVVVADGTLAFYRGREGIHQSMRAATAVSDGKWHHVAVSFDDETGWSHLFVDGVAADSLLDRSWASDDFAWDRGRAAIVGIGDRVASSRSDLRDSGDLSVVAGASDVAFTGMLDDITVWPTALDQRDVLRVAYDMFDRAQPTHRINFEDDVAPDMVPTARVFRALRDPMADVRVHVRGSVVELSWEARSEAVSGYDVQQSSDGNAFRQVGTLAPKDGRDGTFTFSDASADGRVVYYRVTQRLASGLTRHSPVIKVGLADVMEAATDTPGVLALNNFPNPFRENTAIHYELPADGPVRVSVWDLSGSPVATLVDETQAAGAHDVSFSAGELSAGTYFVRVQQGRYLRSHKLLLVK